MGYSFNAADAPDTSSDFEPVPPGTYLAHLESAEEKGTTSGGLMLALGWVIDGPSHAGRYVWDNLNVVCPSSEKAEEIAKGHLKRICQANNRAGFGHVSELCGATVVIRTKVREQEGYEPRAEVNGYFDPKEHEAKGPRQAGRQRQSTRKPAGTSYGQAPANTAPYGGHGAPQGDGFGDDQIPF